MRFPLEIIKSIQHKCGKDFPVGIRYSGEEWIEGGRKLDESVKVAKIFEEHGACLPGHQRRHLRDPGPTCDPMYYPQGWNTYTAEEIKKNVKIPVITSHSLRDPDYCEKILAEGKADMVGLLAPDDRRSLLGQQGRRRERRKRSAGASPAWSAAGRSR